MKALQMIAWMGVVILSAGIARAADEEITVYRFAVEIEGVTTGAFQEVSGLSMEVEVVEYLDGDDLLLRKRSGRTKYSNITLKRGYVGDDRALQEVSPESLEF